MNFNIQQIGIPLQPNSLSCGTFSIVGMLNHLTGTNLQPVTIEEGGLDAWELEQQKQQIMQQLFTLTANADAQIVQNAINALEIINKLNTRMVENNVVNPEIFNEIIDPSNPNGDYYLSILATSRPRGAHWTVVHININGNNVAINYFDSAGNPQVRQIITNMYTNSFRQALNQHLEQGSNSESVANSGSTKSSGGGIRRYSINYQ